MRCNLETGNCATQWTRFKHIQSQRSTHLFAHLMFIYSHDGKYDWSGCTRNRNNQLLSWQLIMAAAEIVLLYSVVEDRDWKTAYSFASSLLRILSLRLRLY